MGTLQVKADYRGMLLITRSSDGALLFEASLSDRKKMTLLRRTLRAHQERLMLGQVIELAAQNTKRKRKQLAAR